jgi:hypothetical protein
MCYDAWLQEQPLDDVPLPPRARARSGAIYRRSGRARARGNMLAEQSGR